VKRENRQRSKEGEALDIDKRCEEILADAEVATE
jgi:hypothetical protein